MVKTSHLCQTQVKSAESKTTPSYVKDAPNDVPFDFTGWRTREEARSCGEHSSMKLACRCVECPGKRCDVMESAGVSKESSGRGWKRHGKRWSVMGSAVMTWKALDVDVPSVMGGSGSGDGAVGSASVMSWKALECRCMELW